MATDSLAGHHDVELKGFGVLFLAGPLALTVLYGFMRIAMAAFTQVRDASKVALVALVERLKAGGFSLMDTQFLTPHLATFGALEIPRARYLLLLEDAIRRESVWT